MDSVASSTLCGHASTWLSAGPVLVSRGNPTSGTGPLTLRWTDGTTTLLTRAADTFYSVASDGNATVAVAWSAGGKMFVALAQEKTGKQAAHIVTTELGLGCRPTAGWLPDPRGDQWCIAWAEESAVALALVDFMGQVTWVGEGPGGPSVDYPSIFPAAGGGAVAWREAVTGSREGKFRVGVVLGATGVATYSEVGWYDPSVTGHGALIWMGAHQAGRTVGCGLLTPDGHWDITEIIPDALYLHLAYGGGVLARAYARYEGGGSTPTDPDALRRAVWEISTDLGHTWCDVSPTRNYRMIRAGVSVSSSGQVLATWVDATLPEAPVACMEVVQ